LLLRGSTSLDLGTIILQIENKDNDTAKDKLKEEDKDKDKDKHKHKEQDQDKYTDKNIYKNNFKFEDKD
jgi:hypothetical protein